MLFLLGGMTACILSSYITTYLALILNADGIHSVTELAPFVEEIIKFSPVFFYILVFKPKREKLPENIMMVSVGFATFENVCYLLNNGSEMLLQLLVRGFATGAMHVVCGAVVSMGLRFLWEKRWLHIAGTAGLITLAISYHSIYNILVIQTGVPMVIGFFIPMLTAAGILLFRKKD